MKTKLHQFLIVLSLFACASRAIAQSVNPNFGQQQVLTAADGAAGDQFAWPVALSADGNTAFIGASAKNVGSNALQGAVYVFTRSGLSWVQQQELTAADGAAGDFFGSSMELSGDGSTALIGANNKTIGTNSGQGAAYVFTRSGSTWVQQQELTASDGAAVDYFASVVALSADGSNAVITAFNKNIGGNSMQGAAYVFTRSGSAWGQQNELTLADGAAHDGFGNSAALSADGNTALIRASGKFLTYVFIRSGSNWVQQQQLPGGSGSIALSADASTVLIGDINKSVGSSPQGASSIFTRSGSNWVPGQVLAASDGAPGDSFGTSGALTADGSIALISAGNKKILGNFFQGAAYVFTRSGSNWVQQQELTAADGAAGDKFGNSAKLSGDGGIALIGARSKNSLVGAAYVFAEQTAGVPNLNIVPNGPNSVTVSWPNTGSYTLLQNSNLADGSWTTNGNAITTNYGTNSVIITPSVGNRFFRLSQP